MYNYIILYVPDCTVYQIIRKLQTSLKFHRKVRTPPLQEDFDGIYCDIAGRNLDRAQNVPEPNLRTRGLVPEVSLAMRSIENLHHGSMQTIGSMAGKDSENCDNSNSDSDESDMPM